MLEMLQQRRNILSYVVVMPKTQQYWKAIHQNILKILKIKFKLKPQTFLLDTIAENFLSKMLQFNKIRADSCKNKFGTTLEKRAFADDTRLGGHNWRMCSNGKIGNIYS